MTTESPASTPPTSAPPPNSWHWRIAEYYRTVERNPWIPQPIKTGLSTNARQRQFLLLSDVYEVFYGGAAGGGKTVATLTAAAQHLDVPGYSALLLRENFADLSQPGAWIPLSKSWWMNTRASWNATERRWTFPSGATITFGYLERDDSVYQYDTASYQYVSIDELVQHSEWRYKFMFGRIRRPASGPLASVPLRMRSASNPGNMGHAWVKARFIDAASREPGAVFVPARLEDNAGNLDAESYRRDSLSKLDPVTRAQREEGDWDAVASGRFDGVALRRHRYRFVDRHGAGQAEIEFLLDGVPQGRRVRLAECSVFLTCDPAASDEPIRKTGNPDFTVICAWALTPEGHLVWLDCVRFRLEIPKILPQVQDVYSQWRPLFVGIEAVASNCAVFQYARETSMIVEKLDPRGRNKLERAIPAMNRVDAGRVWTPERAHWLDQAVTELLSFAGDGKTKDDVVDNLSYACKLAEELDEGRAASSSRPMVVGTRGW